MLIFGQNTIHYQYKIYSMETLANTHIIDMKICNITYLQFSNREKTTSHLKTVNMKDESQN